MKRRITKLVRENLSFIVLMSDADDSISKIIWGRFTDIIYFSIFYHTAKKDSSFHTSDIFSLCVKVFRVWSVGDVYLILN